MLAIGFIVSLYRKLMPHQWALKWGLPLVLGGALGNLVNRLQFNYVVDFIDFRAGWVRWLNGFLSQHPRDHWPTFNIADIAIVAGVVLMAIDMFTPAPKALVAVGGAPVSGPQAATDAPAPRPVFVANKLAKVGDYAQAKALLDRLGKHSAGKACLYVKRLADVDSEVLEALIAQSVAAMRTKYSFAKM